MSQRITPNQLLAWSIINQETEKEDRTVNRPLEPIDPKWIEIILGKPDSARMMENIGCILSDADLDKRLEAFDELELLVESMDNALDLQPLKQWPNILGMLNDPAEEIRLHACWVMGTAVQNNLKCQRDFARQDGINILLNFMKNEKCEKVILKSIYCLSSAIRQNKSNFDIFTAQSGFKILKEVCSSGVEPIIKRVLFFVSSLIRDEMVLEDGNSAESVSESVINELLNVGFLNMVLEMTTQQAEADEDYLKFIYVVFSAYPALKKSEFGAEVSAELPKLFSSNEEVSRVLAELRSMF